MAQQPAPETVAVPAIGYSIVANVGGERQFTAQCFVEQGESDADIDAKIDRVMKRIDRQRAIYGLEDMEMHLAREQLNLFNGEQQIVAEETKYEASVDALEGRKRELMSARNQIQEEAYARGRENPVGAEGGRYNSMGKEIGEIDKQLADLAKGRKNGLQMAAPGLDKQKEIISDIEAKIARAKALINGG